MKFRINDKIVCINDGYLETEYGFREPIDYIIVGNIYTVERPDCGGSGIKLKEIDNHYINKNRFISLTEYRKMKLKCLM